MNKSLRWWEWLACLALIVVLSLVLVLPTLARANTRKGLRLCQYNMKQLHAAIKMYASESSGSRLPPRSPIPGNWTTDPNALYPEYLADLSVFICPASPRAHADAFTLRRTLEHPGEPVGRPHPDCVSSEFYIYLGHMVTHDDMALALYRASHEAPPEALIDADIQMPIRGFDMLRDSGPGLPILWERIPEFDDEFPHGRKGINVLHMDGHVMFVPYDPYNGAADFPVTYVSAQTFSRDVPRLSVDCY